MNLDPDPVPEEVGDPWPEWTDKAYGYQPVVSPGVQRWVLLAIFALGLLLGIAIAVWRG